MDESGKVAANGRVGPSRARLVGRYLRYLPYVAIERRTPYPLILFIELTKRCNLRCRQCDMWIVGRQVERDGGYELTLDDLERLADEAAANGALLAQIYGGEPLVRPDAVEAVAVFARRGLKVGVTTNGSLLTPELIDRLVAAGLKRLIVSVDHHLAAEHDDLRGQAGLLANVERAVRYAASRHAAAGLSVEANTVAHRRNFRALAELSATLHAWGARTHNVHPIMDYYPLKISAQSREASADLFFQPADLPALRGEVDRYFAALRALGMAATTTAELWRRAFEFYAGRHQRYICAIAGVSVDVLADGEVEFCCGAEITFGNIRRHSLRELWRSPEAQRQHQQLRHCVRCVDSCQADLRLRFSPAYLLRRLPDVLREAWRLT